MNFARDTIHNLLGIKEDIENETYKFGGYITFTVTEPKEREINAPHYRDKIIQLAINNVIKEIYEPKFIYDSYACINGRGTHSCVQRIYHFMRKAYWEYGEEAFIVKADMKKFFYSIVRQILKELLSKEIKCDKTRNLIFKIIDSADVIDVLGMPLGNTISQLCANVYLNQLDQYAKRGLSLKYYVRYMDDIVIIVENKERAQEVLKLIDKYVTEKLSINLNKNKSKIFPIAQGVNTIGFKIYPTHMLLRNESKKKIKQKLSKMKRLIVENQMAAEKAEQILNSWLGHAKQANSYNFVNKLLDKYDFLIMEDNKFKIDERVIENERTVSS